ncbi:LysR family transcriptional regulator [Echinicola marina]|uniref:LysR family transcriptional regulator n=1 Tax=Echinicola marina TaxID=2859768 RepID=UPI001CF67DC7|nr:LysR family transcriptional regulator [Echinicola marina]UCS91698.1 LysR family transcriptional regulator [Echinicola marina]
MDLQQIRYFLVLAKELHFWKTAEQVYITQSSLSRKIQALEEEVGTKLFERNKRNVKLTDAGVFFKERWEQLLDEIDRTHQHTKTIGEGKSGRISISYPGSIAYVFLPSLLDKLANSLPKLKVELMEPVDISQEKLLLDYHIDLALSRDKIQNMGIITLPLFSESICLVVPEGHWMKEEDFTSLEELKDEKFILSGLHHSTYFASLLRGMFHKYNFEPNIHIESDFGGMILNLVAKGLGISILPYSFKFAARANVRFISLPEEVRLFVNWRKNDNRAILKNVIELSKEVAADWDINGNNLP